MREMGVPRVSAANSNTRSRPRQDWAYSPIGAGGVASEAPPVAGETNGYTFPVDRDAMELVRYRRAMRSGSATFISHAQDGLVAAPNFAPTMKTTFGASGRALR